MNNLAQKQEYVFIIKNCDMYMVKENGNKHWLCRNKILTEWSTCGASNNFESWVFPSKDIAKNHFNDRSFDNEW